MSKFFTSMEELLEVLNRFEYTSADSKSIIGDGVKVSYRTELNQHNVEEYPIQIVVRVELDGVHAFTYGCIDNEMNSQFTKWFLTNKYKAEEVEYKIERAIKDRAEKRFNELLEVAKVKLSK